MYRNFRHRTSNEYVVTIRFLALFAFVFAGIVAITTMAQGQIYTDLHDINISAGDPNQFQSIGFLPQGRDGNLYGVSPSGGTANVGTAFKFTLAGTPTVLHSFDGLSTGSLPYYGLTLGSDGNFYGVASYGGSAGHGDVYKITPTGTVTVLHNFTNGSDGTGPLGPPAQGNDGNFYGATGYGATGFGTSVFYKVTPTGTFTTLHTFASAEGSSCGYTALGSDGNFYGGCDYDGANSAGTVFKISPTGKLTVLHSFTGIDGHASSLPVLASNGSLYGVTASGGTIGVGVIYKLTTNGTYTVLHNFTNGADGGSPSSGLTLGPDGNLYGTAAGGGNVACGSGGCGVIFKITTGGAYTVLHTFDGTHGANPQSNLTLDTDGTLYGITNGGGANSQGVFYSFNVGFSPFVNLEPTQKTGFVGASVGVFGQGFSGASVVKFGGVTATSVTLTGTTYLTAVVPAGAHTGTVTVTTGATTLTSPQTYKVKPKILNFTPPSGHVGQLVTINGTGLIQTSAVKFGAVKATTVTVVSDSQVTAVVPTLPLGAVTISITTPGGAANSATKFTAN